MKNPRVLIIGLGTKNVINVVKPLGKWENLYHLQSPMKLRIFALIVLESMEANCMIKHRKIKTDKQILKELFDKRKIRYKELAVLNWLKINTFNT